MIYNQNLERGYVPNWALWEALREPWANAVDAGPFTYEINENELVLRSEASPTMEQLFILGEGTKSADGKTIGQNAEGFKLAALVCARNGWSLRCRAPWGSARFEFRKHEGMNVETLHAITSKIGAIPSGFEVVILAPGVAETLRGKIVDAPIGRIAKGGEPSPMKLYHRGLFVCEMPDKSVWDWNVQHVELNRDRSIPSAWSVRSVVGNALVRVIDDDPKVLNDLMSNFSSFEMLCLRSVWMPDRTKKVIGDYIRRVHGAKSCIGTGDPKKDHAVRTRGYNTLVAYKEYADCCDLQTAEAILETAESMTPSVVQPSTDAMQELYTLLDLLEIRATVQIFADDGMTLGRAKIENKIIEVWLNETMFQPGARMERISTFLHELGHVKGGDDESREFENSLDHIAGKLAIALLHKKGG